MKIFGIRIIGMFKDVYDMGECRNQQDPDGIFCYTPAAETDQEEEAQIICGKTAVSMV